MKQKAEQPRDWHPEAASNRTDETPKIIEESQLGKLNQRFVSKHDALSGAEYLVMYPRRRRGLNRQLETVAVSRDGEVFINPASLGFWVALTSMADQVLIVVDADPLVPLSWVKANFPEHAEALQDLEIKIRGWASTPEVAPKQEESK